MAGNSTDIKERFTLRKSDRLHHRTLVKGLFDHGKSMYEYPLRLTWRVLTDEDLSSEFRHGVPEGIGRTQVLITVPKRMRRRAVDRVLMRRRIREAYRLSRRQLVGVMEAHPELRTLQMAFIYLRNENVDYDEIRRKMQKLLRRLAAVIEKEERT